MSLLVRSQMVAGLDLSRLRSVRVHPVGSLGTLNPCASPLGDDGCATDSKWSILVLAMGAFR